MLWFLCAWAASPGGVRHDPALPVTAVGVRQAVSMSTTVAQTTLAARTSFRGRVSIAASMPLVITGGRASRTGVGLLRGGLFIHFGKSRAGVWTVGQEFAAQVVPNRWTMNANASIARDVSPAGEGLTSLQFAMSPESPTQFRVAAGLRGSSFNNEWGYNVIPIFEFSMVRVQPIAGPLSAVAEAELTLDRKFASVRLLARFDIHHTALDLGVQTGMASPGPHGALIGSVRQFF